MATTDTATVDLSGDGTAGAPLTAAVKVQGPEPNGLSAGPLGLVVRPSADAGNALTIGADGDLFVPPPAPSATVAPVTGGAPAPVGTARSVDIDVTESPAHTFNVGARLSPPWAQGGLQSVVSAGMGQWNLGQELAVPEDGVYLIEAFVTGYAGILYPRATADYSVVGAVGVDGTRLKEGVVMQNAYTLSAPAAMSNFETGAATFTFRQQLTAGQKVQGWVQFNGTYVGGDGLAGSVSVAFNKISD
ncbi:hypothetical protein [Streptomyces sp. SAI-127]|uniref:hypothetical protein n=1 Tax=Streptomyces sp. SAI-127 TaxID=2940543 RepID=UPI002473C6AD|nr:hypothetical protein [Streptomyces sp. SAI-127]